MEESSPTNVKKTKKKSKTNWFVTIGISLILTAIVLVICFFLQGETKTSGGWPDPEISKSMSCEVEGLEYPLFKYDNSSKKSTKITAVFSADKLKTISLVQQQYYDNSDAVKRSEVENHAAMNLLMQDEGLGPDALGMNFAKLSDNLKMSLYAEAKSLNYNTVKYFELDWVEGGVYNSKTIQTIYEKKGFKCVANEG